MFGLVLASTGELNKEQKKRYQGMYCGICRSIGQQVSNIARLGLRYDMVFLSMLLTSLYGPEEETGTFPCILHPKREWNGSRFTQYAADMNVALAYYQCLDDWQDDRKLSAKALAAALEKHIPALEEKYPRQCAAMQKAISAISQLERENCPDPDAPAGAFGELMAELMVYEQDLWEGYLRGLGNSLGRFIYLCDAIMDYGEDKKSGSYNPFLAGGVEKDPEKWEEILILTMARCTESFEALPLVQDKDILDNILYSGIWLRYRKSEKGRGSDGT